MNTEQLVWIIGFDDRKTKLAESEKQLMGHTKQYTKVVLTQSADILGSDQPAQALVGKCVKIKVTGTHKWHISGYIIDACPKPVEVSADYFEKLDRERKEKLRKELQDDLAAQKRKELERKLLMEQQTLAATKPDQTKADEIMRKAFMVHFAGILVMGVGVYLVLKFLDIKIDLAPPRHQGIHQF